MKKYTKIYFDGVSESCPPGVTVTPCTVVKPVLQSYTGGQQLASFQPPQWPDDIGQFSWFANQEAAPRITFDNVLVGRVPRLNNAKLEIHFHFIDSGTQLANVNGSQISEEVTNSLDENSMEMSNVNKFNIARNSYTVEHLIETLNTHLLNYRFEIQGSGDDPFRATVKLIRRDDVQQMRYVRISGTRELLFLLGKYMT